MMIKFSYKLSLCSLMLLSFVAGFIPLVAEAQQAPVQRVELYNALNGYLRSQQSTTTNDHENAGEQLTSSIYGTSLIYYSLQAPRNSVVRGAVKLGLILDIVAGGLNVQLLLDRAYIRARLPIGERYKYQFELGLNTLSFGEGQVYNAGDIVFGSEAFSLDNLAGEFRNNPLWNLRLYFPLGTLSFIEAVMHYPTLRINATLFAQSSGADAELEDNGAGNNGAANIFPDADEVEFSTRAGLSFDLLELEFGTNYSPKAQYFTPYVSLNIPLVVNIYMAASSRFFLPVGENNQDLQKQFYDASAISAGISYITGVPNGDTLDLRFEALYKLETLSFFLSSNWIYSSRFTLATQLFYSVDITDIYATVSQGYVKTGPYWTLFDGFAIMLAPSFGIEQKDEYMQYMYQLGLTVQYIY